MQAKSRNKKSYRRAVYLLLFIAFAGLIITACTSTLTIVSQDATVTPGDSAHMVISIQWSETNYDRTDRQVVAICVPKAWDAANNTTMTYTSDAGNGKMVVIPDGTTEPSTGLAYPTAMMNKFSIGANYINDLEWVAFWSDNKLSVENGKTVNGKIYISIKTGTDYLSFKPGYAICEDEDGLSDANSGYYQSQFGACMEVIGSDATQDVEDMCNPQIGSAEPTSATENDIITIKYNGNLDTSALKNKSNIYFCAKAYTTTGDSMEVCDPSAQTQLTLFDTKQWRIDLWPKKFFSLPNGVSLKQIQYYFTDETGAIKTGYGNTADPFKYTFKCK
ncbi:DUF4961 domain-containing protein [Parafilimonas sp.]|uniref:DUF4961 domain-containing protein n=1 Tax=Parafilimonas sp. TaxID=1969739 RepID=UPI0039E673C0